MASASALSVGGFNGYRPILRDQITTLKLPEGSLPQFSDEAAASLVIQDYNIARAYLDNNSWMLQWDENDILYQSPLLHNPDDTSRARVSRFTVNNQTNTMSDATKSGLFSQKPPFLIRKRGKTSQRNVDAWTALLDVLLDRMKFRYWTGLGIDSQALHGTMIMKGGWNTRTRVVKRRKQKTPPTQITQPAGNTQTVDTKESDAFDIVYDKIEESFPWIENRMLGTTLFDPGWRTPNAPELCGYAVDVDYVTWMDLEEMRQQDCYKIPPAAVLKDWFFHHDGQDASQGATAEQNLSSNGSVVLHAESRATQTTADPLGQRILMLSRNDSGRVMVILLIDDRCVVIQNEEHGFGRIPHFTANWRNILNTGYGMGIGKLIGGDQRVEQGVLNHSLNLLAYQFNPAILHAIGANAPTGNRMIRAGGYYAVNPIGGSVHNAVGVMEMPKVPAEAWQMIQYVKASSEESSGADATFMGGSLQGRGSSAARTATGAGRIAQKSDGRVQTPVENLELGLFNPYLLMLIDMVKTYMPMAEVREILSSKLTDAIMKDFDGSSFMEADLEVEMLAASKLAAKAAMAQQLPFLMQIFQQPQLLEQLHAEGKTIDLGVILDVLFAVSEFRMEDDIIRDLTPEELQKVQAGQPAPESKLQVAIGTETVKGQNQIALEDRKAQNDIAKTVTERALEHNDSGLPLTRATGLVERGDDEAMLKGQGPSPLAGVD